MKLGNTLHLRSKLEMYRHFENKGLYPEVLMDDVYKYRKIYRDESIFIVNIYNQFISIIIEEEY